jgi:lysophospholipase L1-like esterase
MSSRRHTAGGGHSLPAKLSLALLALVVVGMIVQTFRGSPAPAATGPAWSPSPSQVAARPFVAFLGDSYTSGSSMGGTGAAGWPAILSASHGWNFRLYSSGGSGFVNPGPTNITFGQRIAAIVAANPSIVYVEGGHNDLGRNPEAAISVTIARLRAGLPDARIVILSPIWPTTHPPAGLAPITAALKAEALKAKAVFVDTSQWFAGSHASLIGQDGTHPTDPGHQYIAQLLTQNVATWT